MLTLDLSSLEKLLMLGIGLIVAALVGGGIDAAGILKLPVFRDWRTQSAVGSFGALIMIFSVVSMNSADFATRLEKLRTGASGLPPPPWPAKLVNDELEGLAVKAARDATKNCEIASFIEIHNVQLPLSIKIRLKNSAQLSEYPELTCYREVIDAAKDSATRNASVRTRPDEASDLVALRDHDGIEKAQLVDARSSDAFRVALEYRAADALVAQATEVAPSTAGTNILEAIASVGQRGWMYIGSYRNGALGADRTIVDQKAIIGQDVTTRTAVNLREIGSDTNYRSHRVACIVPPGARLVVETLTPAGEIYRWARVRIVHLG